MPLQFEAEPFLCFSRGDARDIVLGQHKVLGSAQRRRRGAVLQHGSLLLALSEFAPEFPGLRELTSFERSIREVAVGLRDVLAPLLPGETHDGILTEVELERAPSGRIA